MAPSLSSLTVYSSAHATQTHAEKEMRSLAKKLEASFLNEMLKAAKFGEPRQGLGGGGIGEEQFSSILREVQAEKMVEAGGLGLAQTIFESMLKGRNETV